MVSYKGCIEFLLPSKSINGKHNLKIRRLDAIKLKRGFLNLIEIATRIKITTERSHLRNIAKMNRGLISWESFFKSVIIKLSNPITMKIEYHCVIRTCFYKASVYSSLGSFFIRLSYDIVLLLSISIIYFIWLK